MVRKYCERCKKKLSRKQQRWCSLRCSKLGLKALYRKRNKKKINDYNKTYRALGIRGNPSTNIGIKRFLERNNFCARCGTDKNVNVCHIKPRWAGGKNKDNLIPFCNKCHHYFDNLLRGFWKYK